MAKRRAPFIPNGNVAFWGGIAAYLFGSFLLWDAYEHRGKDRPFAMRFLPGA